MSRAAKQLRAKKQICFLLHAHLPFGIRPELEFSLEEAWLHEAVINCYLPLLDLLNSLPPTRDKQQLTISLSPTLLELWALPDFSDRFRRHLSRGLSIIDSEIKNASRAEAIREQAKNIRNQWELTQKRFDRIDGDLIEAFRRHSSQNSVEFITTTATHAFLPAFQGNKGFRRFQIETGLDCFEKHLGIRPTGFWLPECGYFPGLEDDLAYSGVTHFAVEANAIHSAKPASSIYEVIRCPNGLSAVGRNSRLSAKVWNARIGYPGNAKYREFHYDGIHDIDTKEAGLFALPGGGRIPLGLKYWKVTGSTDKEIYAPSEAGEQVRRDATDFYKSINAEENGITLLPFDAELFGHWWFEGPRWLHEVFELIDKDSDLEASSLGTAIENADSCVEGTPATSSWGQNADASFWINHETDWIFPLIENATNELLKATSNTRTTKQKKRLLNQAFRELLVASASDWPFMIRAGATEQYAIDRIRHHFQRFFFLMSKDRKLPLDSQKLDLIEKTNPIFGSLDHISKFERASS